MMQQSFSKDKRLVSNEQFRNVLACGRRLDNNLLTVYIAENNCGYPRLGVSIGKIHGNAIKRNRLKRFIREAFRQCQEQIPNNYDYLVMIKKTVKQTTFEQIRKSFLTLVISAPKNI